MCTKSRILFSSLLLQFRTFISWSWHARALYTAVLLESQSLHHRRHCPHGSLQMPEVPGRRLTRRSADGPSSTVWTTGSSLRMGDSEGVTPPSTQTTDPLPFRGLDIDSTIALTFRLCNSAGFAFASRWTTQTAVFAYVHIFFSLILRGDLL